VSGVLDDSESGTSNPSWVEAARTRETYMAVLRPWFGFLSEHGYPWNARPEAVREYTRLFLIEARCALRAGRVDGWFIQATNRSPISGSGLHLLIAALRSFYSVMHQGVFDPEDQRFHPLYPYERCCSWPKSSVTALGYLAGKQDRHCPRRKPDDERF